MSVTPGFIAAVQTLTARAANGEYVPNGWDSWMSEADIISVASRPAGVIFVNVYALGREYGGSEEGGWWFDTGSVVLSITCESEEHAQAVQSLLSELYVDHRNRFSVIYYRKAPDYGVYVEDVPARDFPEHTPHYE
jgi:hypothetical protein